MPDIRVLLGTYMSEAMGVGFSEALSGASEEEIEEKMKAVFLRALEETDDVTMDHVVPLVMEGGAWKIDDGPLPGVDWEGLLQEKDEGAE